MLQLNIITIKDDFFFDVIARATEFILKTHPSDYVELLEKVSELARLSRNLMRKQSEELDSLHREVLCFELNDRLKGVKVIEPLNRLFFWMSDNRDNCIELALAAKVILLNQVAHSIIIDDLKFAEDGSDKDAIETFFQALNSYPRQPVHLKLNFHYVEETFITREMVSRYSKWAFKIYLVHYTLRTETMVESLEKLAKATYRSLTLRGDRFSKGNLRLFLDFISKSFYLVRLLTLFTCSLPGNDHDAHRRTNRKPSRGDTLA